MTLSKEQLIVLKKYEFDHFLRICGDRPFFNYKFIDELLYKLNKKKINYQLISQQ